MACARNLMLKSNFDLVGGKIVLCYTSVQNFYEFLKMDFEKNQLCACSRDI